MTLILATITPKGVVLAADRRTITFNSKLNAHRILTDDAEKILVSDNIAIAVIGKNTNVIDTGEYVIRKWLKNTYISTHDPAPQLDQIYNTNFASKNRGGFIAAFFQANCSTVIFTKAGEPLQTQVITSKNNPIMKFFGSGNLIAADLVDAANPILSEMDFEHIREFSAEIIEKTHREMMKDTEKLPSVGPKVMAAIINNSGVKLQYKED